VEAASILGIPAATARTRYRAARRRLRIALDPPGERDPDPDQVDLISSV
jgi:DNA-directed RNA polymerase specialized sigma24 family protein